MSQTSASDIESFLTPVPSLNLWFATDTGSLADHVSDVLQRFLSLAAVPSGWSMRFLDGSSLPVSATERILDAASMSDFEWCGASGRVSDSPLAPQANVALRRWWPNDDTTECSLGIPVVGEVESIARSLNESLENYYARGGYSGVVWLSAMQSDTPSPALESSRHDWHPRTHVPGIGWSNVLPAFAHSQVRALDDQLFHRFEIAGDHRTRLMVTESPLSDAGAGLGELSQALSHVLPI